uniref:Interleukin-8 n=1 Tax=Mugil incilis TaxID=426483 RepID=A0A977TIL1_9TELE|nr:interleukin-8 [Mugil incilis]
MSVITIVALLVVLFSQEGMTAGNEGAVLRCQCIATEKKPIGRFIAAVEVRLPTSECRDTEIVAILKKNRRRVCLDPNAPWIQKVLKKLATRPQ